MSDKNINNLSLNSLFTIFFTISIIFNLAPPSAFAEPLLSIEKNEAVGLFRFVSGLCGAGQTSKMNIAAYAEMYENKDEDKDKVHVENFKKIFEELPKSFDLFPDRELPPSRKFKSYTELLYYYAAAARDLRQFEFSIYAMMPFDYADKLVACLQHFKPIYQKIHCKPTDRLLDDYLKRTRNSDFIKQLQRFYGADSKCPEIKVIIVPVYISKKLYDKYNKSMSACSVNYGNLQIIEVLFTGDKFKDPYDVIVHELCHFYYDLSSEIEKTVKKLTGSNSINGKFCARIINEALATSIGNGYFGATDLNTNWYEDEAIDKYAKSLFPCVKKYMDSNITINEKFNEEILNIFNKTFIDAQNNLSFLLYDIHVISDAISTRNIFKEINSFFYCNGYQSSGTIDSPKMLENFKRHKDYTTVFVTNRAGLNSLKAYKLEGVETLIKDKFTGPAVYFNYDKIQKCNYLIFICKTVDELKALLNKLSAARIIQPSKLISINSGLKK